MTRKARVLIVDDEPDIRELLEITLGRMQLETETAATAGKAREKLAKQAYDLCLTDMKLPDGNGIELIEYIQQKHPKLPVAVITAFGSMDLAITALKAGAFDFISKPIDLETLRGIVLSALNLETGTPQTSKDTSTLLLGESPQIRQLREQIIKLARSQAPVYIHGESGTGKELVARAIHESSGRSGSPFIAVNCGAIPRELMESEFFGHRKGSFTGATADKQGLFLAAQGGTLFLDEVADLPLDMQVKLLRAVQEKMVRPVGADKEIPVNIRLLSATHKDLQQEVSNGRFRQDLYFRINVIQLPVPPLRERGNDILLLAQHFLNQFNQGKDNPVTLSDEARQTLLGYSFPGNVRELENMLERACTLCEKHTIRSSDLNLQPMATEAALSIQAPMQDSVPAESLANTEKLRKSFADAPFKPRPVHPAFHNLDQYIEDIERATLEQVLEESRWNKTLAAKRLGISFRQLRYKLKKLGME